MQSIRDPLHNLVDFDTNQFEHVLWQVINTRPLQRLRRSRQLGFCELVYPGATHTPFAHSVGVSHTARQLMNILKGHVEDSSRIKSPIALDIRTASANSSLYGP
jgi:HD superfamily phosphohydrolase